MLLNIDAKMFADSKLMAITQGNKESGVLDVLICAL